MEGKFSWRSTKLVNELNFTEGYWEWTEDILATNKTILEEIQMYDAISVSLATYDYRLNVMQRFLEHWSPSTNTLCTSNGEMSIPLSFLTTACGLPLEGDFYDEVVPSAEELLKQNHIPWSCTYLFCAFRRHCRTHKVSQMSILEWVQFWYHGPPRYQNPPARSNRKRGSMPKNTYNPTGFIKVSYQRPKGWNKALTSLNVAENLEEEVYLAAFISCWLCKFALPNEEVDQIRPSTFKIASLLAASNKGCIAIPVLASIFRGLRTMCTSPSLRDYTIDFPIHFVHAWLADTFDTHFVVAMHDGDCRIIKYKGEKMARDFNDEELAKLFTSTTKQPKATLCSPTKPTTLVDNETLSRYRREHFINLRSCFLTLRYNGIYIAEPYSPHRFSRQFGFTQDILGSLKKTYENLNLPELKWLWESSTRLSTHAQAKLPTRSSRGYSLVTYRYEEWWRKIWLQDFTPKTKNLIKKGSDASKIDSNPQVANPKTVLQPLLKIRKVSAGDKKNAKASAEDTTPSSLRIASSQPLTYANGV